jgi:hypothetical protein
MILYFLNRLQGIVANMTRIPSFRRRFGNLVKALYYDVISNGTIKDSVSSRSGDRTSSTQAGSENNGNVQELSSNSAISDDIV